MGPALLSVLAPILTQIVGGLFPDPVEKSKAEAEVMKQLLASQGELEKATSEIIKTEAASEHWLAANWRPLTMLLVEGDGAAARDVLRSLESRVARLPESAREDRQSWISFYRGWLGVLEHDAAGVDRMIAELETDATDDLRRRLVARLQGEAALGDLRFEDAVGAFEQAATSDPFVLVRLAAAYDGLGRSATATALYNEAASCDTFDFECALARGLAQPIGWPAPPSTAPFDWESTPPETKDGAPDTIARLGQRLESTTRSSATPSAGC